MARRKTKIGAIMEIRDTANPVGEIQVEAAEAAIENYVSVLAYEWEKSKIDAPWWKFWQRLSMVRVTDFMLGSLEDMISFVDQITDIGPDKKATVMTIMGRIYDIIVKDALPVWLTPFAKSIKSLIMEEVISPVIDWMVTKYREGAWKPTAPAAEMAAQWEVKAQLIGVPGGHRPK